VCTPPSERPEPESIPDLIRTARAGCQQALGRLSEHARPYLNLLAEHHWPGRLRRHLDPADLVQETFGDICRGFHTFRGNTEPEWIEWLRQVLRHNMVSARRRLLAQKRRADRTVSLDGMPPGEVIAREWLLSLSTPGTRAVKAEAIARLADALDQLTPEQYRVVLLRYYEGWTYREIGEALGSSEDAIRQFWYRILLKLRELLGGTDESP
jgi:RNA polymerase sigma-70 factor (ECF subfamily)